MQRARRLQSLGRKGVCIGAKARESPSHASVAHKLSLSPPRNAQTTKRTAAESTLKAFQEHPDSWMRVDGILESAQTEQAKFFALQVRVLGAVFEGGG